MVLATVIVSVLLAALLSVAAGRKLSHTEEVVRSYQRAGVPEDRLNQLAVILLAGAAGLVAGLFWRPLGIAAAAAVLAYFVVAIGFHIRANDLGRAGTPVVLALIAAATLVLQLVR